MCHDFSGKPEDIQAFLEKLLPFFVDTRAGVSVIPAEFIHFTNLDKVQTTNSPVNLLIAGELPCLGTIFLIFTFDGITYDFKFHVVCQQESKYH